MNQIRVAAIAALVAGGQALGASTMTFTAKIGGDPQVAQWESFAEPAYTPGSATPAPINADANGKATVNWSVDGALTGLHANPGGPGDGVAPNGIANFVFHLELHSGTAGGPLVQVGRMTGNPNTPGTSEGFYSIMNDGDTDGLRGLFGADPLENADFAHSFAASVGGGAGVGRVWDEKVSGGPRLDRAQFPSVNGKAGGHQNGNTYVAATGTTSADLGKLIGMGAGYSQYTNTGDIRTPGVGNSGSCAKPVVALAEGQIRLPCGTYTLVVVPGSGNNILRGDFNCSSAAPASFALPVNNAAGSSVSFTIQGCQGGLTLASAVSRRNHGGTPVAYDIPLTLGGMVREPRQAGVNPSIVFTYSGAPGAQTCANYGVVNTGGATCSSVNVSGNTAEVILNLPPGTKNTCLTVTALAATGSNVVSVSLHEGNVNTSGPSAGINLIDMNDVKAALFQPVTASNFRLDVQLSNSINLVDMNAVKGNLFVAAQACP